jgi:hypothetical protein
MIAEMNTSERKKHYYDYIHRLGNKLQNLTRDLHVKIPGISYSEYFLFSYDVWIQIQ